MSAVGYDLIVVGGGAAGMMATITAARLGTNVCLVERNAKVGRKLYITGKGRCNVTNHCGVDEVLAATPRNSRFLYSAMSHTPPAEVEKFFTDLGVELKVERGNRVFPSSDRAADIIDALFLELRRLRVPILNERVSGLSVRDGAIHAVDIGTENVTTEIPCKAVILATGGLSYQATGSTGDGHRMAQELGHTIVEPKPSLVPLESPDEFCKEMQGLALKNVTLTVKNKKKKVVYQEQGELLFTHFGISGPLVLSASAHMRDFEKDEYKCSIDLKPALDEEQLDKRILRDFEEMKNKQFKNSLQKLLPAKLIPVIISLTKIDPERQVNEISKKERQNLVKCIKSLIAL